MTEIIRIPCGMVNCYLLRNGSNCMLVDAGNTGDERRLRLALAKNDVAPEQLAMLLLTHGHPDHTGAAEYFRKRHRVKLAMHSADAGGSEPVRGKGVRGALLKAFSSGALKRQKPLRVDIPLDEVQCLDTWGIPARLLHLPGHTAGSVGVLLEDGRLLCGDMYMHMGYAHTAFIAEDFNALAASHARLKELGVATVYPGHGSPFSLEAVK